jgi:hypothetical protein
MDQAKREAMIAELMWSNWASPKAMARLVRPRTWIIDPRSDEVARATMVGRVSIRRACRRM